MTTHPARASNRRRLGMSLGLTLGLGLVACGDSPTIPDAGGGLPIDSAGPGVDAPAQVDASTAGVTVTVTAYTWDNTAQLVPGADVLVHAAGGASVTSRTTTDAAGQATVTVPPGGTVTVVDGNELTTFHAVEDGDQLVAGIATSFGTSAGGIVTIPAGPAGTTNYRVVGPCVFGQSNTTTVPINIRSACGAAPRELLVEARDTPGNKLGYLFQAGVGVAPATTVAVTGTYAAPGTFNVNLGGLPAGTTGVAIRHFATVGPNIIGGNTETLPPPTGSSVTAALQHPAGIGDRTLTGYFIYDGNGGIRSVETALGQASTTLTVADVGAELVPAVTGFAGTPSGLTWTLGAGLPVDGMVLTLEALEKTAVRGTWRLVLPPGATGATEPMLPADLADAFAPVDGVDGELVLIDSHLAAGRAFRQGVFSGAQDPLSVAPPATVRLSRARPNLGGGL